ncbi:hypothetical protein VTL71DRAFT_3727 [Oculimacula yallundae]|uniref:Uncharacterized protein n=1 Tax=Oculimacula yallundae TaxID=86028 RepID=A0ABR4C3T2_9HELO
MSNSQQQSNPSDPMEMDTPAATSVTMEKKVTAQMKKEVEQVIRSLDNKVNFGVHGLAGSKWAAGGEWAKAAEEAERKDTAESLDQAQKQARHDTMEAGGHCLSIQELFKISSTNNQSAGEDSKSSPEATFFMAGNHLDLGQAGLAGSMWARPGMTFGMTKEALALMIDERKVQAIREAKAEAAAAATARASNGEKTDGGAKAATENEMDVNMAPISNL